MVVLSTGMKPDTSKIDKSLLDRNGFFRTDIDTGQYGCGVCTRPKDVASTVQESTGAAMKAIINIRRSK
jgi:heterodisulfide reductase subunit A-like polyferredoxin